MYLSGWAANDDLIQFGGVAVEGAVFVHQINASLPSIKSFSEKYEKLYGSKPGFIGIEAYDAVSLIKNVMERYGTDRKTFYEGIKKVRSFESISGTIQLDAAGDAVRPLYIKKVVHGKIEVIETAE